MGLPIYRLDNINSAKELSDLLIKVPEIFLSSKTLENNISFIKKDNKINNFIISFNKINEKLVIDIYSKEKHSFFDRLSKVLNDLIKNPNFINSLISANLISEKDKKIGLEFYFISSKSIKFNSFILFDINSNDSKKQKTKENYKSLKDIERKVSIKGNKYLDTLEFKRFFLILNNGLKQISITIDNSQNKNVFLSDSNVANIKKIIKRNLDMKQRYFNNMNYNFIDFCRKFDEKNLDYQAFLNETFEFKFNKKHMNSSYFNKYLFEMIKKNGISKIEFFDDDPEYVSLRKFKLSFAYAILENLEKINHVIMSFLNSSVHEEKIIIEPDNPILNNSVSVTI